MAISSSRPRIAVVGAGIIGLSAAYELAVRRAASVTLFDLRTPGRGASWAAAGLLAPAFEAAAHPGVHPRLFELCLESAKLWPAFADELEARSGLPMGLDETASLAAALDASESARLAEVAATLTASAVAHRVLSAVDVRALEPAISPGVVSGLELPSDIRVHNRDVVAALIATLRACGHVTFVSGPAPLRAAGGRLTLDGHDAVLAAAGWQTAVIKVEENGQSYSLVNWDTGLDEIDCHGGQILSVAAIDGAPRRVVRSGDIYLVPRGAEIVIGATVEPGRAIDTPDAAAIDALRLEGVRVCPALAAAPVTGSWTGVRPGTPDQAPFIGPTRTPGLFVAAGHYRNGILLAPVTARIIADQMLGVAAGELAGAFSIRRAVAAAA